MYFPMFLVHPLYVVMWVYIWLFIMHITLSDYYEGWNFDSGNYLFTTDTK